MSRWVGRVEITLWFVFSFTWEAGENDVVFLDFLLQLHANSDTWAQHTNEISI